MDHGAIFGASELVGSDLTASDYAELESRWIDRTLAVRVGLRRVDSVTGAEIVGRKNGNYAGIVIPYTRPGFDRVREYRLRRDQPDLEYDSAGNLKPRQKYLSPPGRSNMLYLVPGINQELLCDTSLPFVITEGEFKTLALWRLATYRSPKTPQFLPLGVSGVFNWRGTIGKANGPNGERLDVKGPIPDLEWLIWEQRKVIIAYDADANCKEQVRIARAEIARHLRIRGALVGFLEWDIEQGKGIDDRLAAIGPDAVLHEISRVEFSGFNRRNELMRSPGIPGKPEGRVYPVLANAITALRHAPEWKGVLAHDEFASRVVALRPAPWGLIPDGRWADHEDRLTAEWLQRQGNLVPVEIAGQAVQTVAKEHCVHPIRQYLESVRWDGTERLDRWLAIYLGADDTQYDRAVGARWLISAVARVYRPGVKADCCLILEGRKGSRNRRRCARSPANTLPMNSRIWAARMRRCKPSVFGSSSFPNWTR